MNEMLFVPHGSMILGEGCYYDLDTYTTRLNNNVLAVGSPGSGKTRGIVRPNILQANGSYVVTDPKGNLYAIYADYLRSKGYEVLNLDFRNPNNSITYNIISKAGTEDDIASLAHMIIFSNHDVIQTDPFWDEAAELLLTAVLAYFRFHLPMKDRTFENVVRLLNCSDLDSDFVNSESAIDLIFRELGEEDPNCFAYRKYCAFRNGAEKTMRSIFIVLQATLSRFDTPSITKVMSGDEYDITYYARRNFALFITISDTDRRLDGLINVVFSQIMQELIRYADSCQGQHLPVPVRFLMDDFATNVSITNFPSMIASIRSRWISVILILQAEAQLYKRYGEDGRTILGSCDTYVYLGGGDLETAANVAKRADRCVKSVLEMPVGTGLIFRRGEKMRECKTFPLEEFERLRMREMRTRTRDDDGK